MKSVYMKNMLGSLGYSNEHFSENYSVQINGTSAIKFDYVAFSDRYLKDVSTSCIAIQEVTDDSEETKYLEGAKYLATPIVIISKNIHVRVWNIAPQKTTLLSDSEENIIHLYFEKDDLENSLHSKSETIHQQIFTRFKTYHYKNKQMSFELRLAQIMYVESMNHKLVIHHDNGDFIERKNLSLFIKEINSSDFIQIHKSFVVNKNYIQEIKAKELILKNSTILPIGRNFKESI